MSERMTRQARSDLTERTTLPTPAAPAWPPAGGRSGGEPSYVPTGLAALDRDLARIDRLTGGKAGLLQRLVSYLTIGGFAALVNLAAFDVLLYAIPLPFAGRTRWLVAFLIAAEVSILANFVPNDRFTFGHLPGHARSWWVRCARFHSTCIGGTTVTFTVSYLANSRGLLPVLAEAAGIAVALCFNFTVHHLWTYRAARPAAETLRLPATRGPRPASPSGGAAWDLAEAETLRLPWGGARPRSPAR
jgi:putative flippase GtrA